MDLTATTNTIAQLTAEQISGMIQERILGLFFSMSLTAIGGIFGAKIRGEVGKIVGLVFIAFGVIGTIGFTLALLNLSTQMLS